MPPTLLWKVETSRSRAPRALFCLISLVASTSRGSANTLPDPSLNVVEKVLVTTAKDSFSGHAKGFEAAAQWNGHRLRTSEGNPRAPHLVCAEYSRGREVVSRLQLYLPPGAIRPVSHSSAHGACFVVTASHAEARAISDNPQLGLNIISPFPSALKVAPGVLEHGASRDQVSQGPGRLATTHGQSMRMSNVEGLNLELSPGTLPAHTPQAEAFVAQLLNDLLSESIDLHAANVWSDPNVATGEHLTTPGGALRKREWSMAATLVHELSVSGRTSPGDICSWGSISIHHAASDLLLVSGLDHLLYKESGPGESRDEATELRVACFMGFVSFLSSRMEVLRVAPRHAKELYNAAARSMIQSATLTEAPLTAAGLDGTGEIIQIVDSGLDETSCYFVDDDGQEVTHGHYYEELGTTSSSSYFSTIIVSTTPSSSSTTYSPTPSSSPTTHSTTSSSSSSTYSPTQLSSSSTYSATPSPSSSNYYFTPSPSWTNSFSSSSTYSPTSSPSSSTYSPTSSPSSGSYSSTGSSSSTSSSTYSDGFEGGDFSFYPDRRKVIQYIDIIKSDSPDSQLATSEGDQFRWTPASGSVVDYVVGHGTHTAGSAAGATLNTPAETVTCNGTEVLGCVGGCTDADGTRSSDDLVSYFSQTSNYADDIDRICPMFECDDETEQWCLSDDVGETLTQHGGMAQGAKLAIFDGFAGWLGLVDLPGNGLWEPCLDAGCKLHSNSWGTDIACSVATMDVAYDDFMYKNPENLLIFSAGNDGVVDDGRTVCTIVSPAIGKNVLAVGATSAGETRLTTTDADGDEADGTIGYADVDTVAWFSSYGPTRDGRIKPEVVAPGDAIYSAGGDSTGVHSCRLCASAGTSMSCPIVAGASAMIRQYFLDASYYAADVTARELCTDEGFLCEAFSPSSATVKALLINSANLMGGSSEPDGFRGFGRIHLEMGMPLGGEESLALFVADSANTSIPELSQQEFVFDVDAEAGLDFRATLSWIDPPATALAAIQLVNDLNLVVVSPSGTTHTMWASGVADSVNVNERVIVAAADVESGNWTVRVSADRLTTDVQTYSLVVNGAIGSLVGDGGGARTLLASSPSRPSSRPSSDTSADPALSSDGSMTSSSWSSMVFLFGALASMIVSACST